MSGVARRYTAGLFDYAKDHGVVDVVDQGLKLVSDTLNEHPEFQSLIENPLISAERKIEMIKEVFGQALDPVVIRFLSLLIRRGRADQLKAVYASFHALAEQAKGVVGVTVESAFAMTDEQVADFEQRLSKVLNKQARVSVVVNPELIAGYRVHVGHRVLDATVKGAVQQFKNRLLRQSALQG
jgi:F-type H+-transporting ATPase subunit delta